MIEAIRIDEDRYARLEQIAWWDQSLLRNAKVLVAGVGALGNEILKNLALLGIGRIAAVDFDTVELSNLTRSVLFREEDRGQPKVQVAARRLAEINPDVRILPIQGDLSHEVGLGLLQRMDIVLAGLDSVGARVSLNQQCWQANVPWIDGALGELSGAVRVFLPPDSACYECGLGQKDYQNLNALYSCNLLPRSVDVEDQTPTTPTIASAIAAWQVQEAVKWLHGKALEPDQGIHFMGASNEFHLLKYKRRSNCLAHDTIENVIKVERAGCDSRTGELLSILRSQLGQEIALELGHEVVYGMLCQHCKQRFDLLAPLFRLSAQDALCPRCGEECSLSMTHHIDDRPPFSEARLRRLGIPPLQILTVKGSQGQFHNVELSADAAKEPFASFFEGESTT